MSATTEKIKERLSIVDVVGSYITLEKSGGNFKAKCPFHNEKSPSFFISPDRGTYYCFGCGEKGDIFSFVEKFEAIDFLGALKLLAERANVPLTFDSKEEKGKNQELFNVLEDACIFFQNQLKNSKEALIYLRDRGLSASMLNNWRIGFALPEWRELKKALLKKYSENLLISAGLIKKADSGESYDRFRSRIMFPIFDSSGRVVAFSGRILNPKSTDEAKYINSPETAVFEKSKILFGLDRAKNAIREKGSVILVEGQMDLLLSHQAGFANTVASSGTAFTIFQANNLSRFTDSIVIAYDADKAGQNASLRVAKIALSEGMKIKAVLLPDGLDPADAIKKDPNIWVDALKNSKDIITFFIDSLQTKNEKEKDEIIKEIILPLIKSIKSPIDQSKKIQELSYKTEISESDLRKEIEKINTFDVDSVKESDVVISKKMSFSYDKKVYLMSIFLENTNNSLSKWFNEEMFRINKDILDEFGDQKQDLLFEAEMHFGNSPNLEQNAREILLLFEEERLKGDLSKSMVKLKKYEIDKNEEGIRVELGICQEISKKLSDIKLKYLNTNNGK